MFQEHNRHMYNDYVIGNTTALTGTYCLVTVKCNMYFLYFVYRMVEGYMP